MSHKKLSEYPLIQNYETVVGVHGDIGRKLYEFYRVPAPVADAADAVIEITKSAVKFLRAGHPDAYLVMVEEALAKLKAVRE